MPGEYMKVVYFWYSDPNMHWAKVQKRQSTRRLSVSTAG